MHIVDSSTTSNSDTHHEEYQRLLISFSIGEDNAEASGMHTLSHAAMATRDEFSGYLSLESHTNLLIHDLAKSTALKHRASEWRVRACNVDEKPQPMERASNDVAGCSSALLFHREVIEGSIGLPP